MIKNGQTLSAQNAQPEIPILLLCGLLMMDYLKTSGNLWKHLETSGNLRNPHEASGNFRKLRKPPETSRNRLRRFPAGFRQVSEFFIKVDYF